jgi:hypothetical protein
MDDNGAPSDFYAGLVRACTFAVGMGSAVAAIRVGIDSHPSQPIAAGILSLASAVAFGFLVLDSKRR